MERSKGYKPSRYQLGFDLGQQALDPEPAESLRFTYEVKENVTVLSPDIAGAYLLSHVYSPFEAFEQEEVWILLLNTRNRITHQSMVYRGTLNTVNIRIAELYKPALRYNAAAIIMSHCHPSSDVSPSPEDIRLTQLAYEAGKLLDVKLLDHFIVGQDQWLSLKSHGVAFGESFS